MRIDFECSGGYANLRLTYHGDSSELPQESAEELLRLVEISRIFEIQPDELVSELEGPPDVFFYRLILQEGDKEISLSLNDITAPASLHPLLSFLQELALKQRREEAGIDFPS